ncbi:MAG: ribonuclease D [Verrucomicrobia bacterium]|nr:MAG: ribonuclease D [Verrucomicrobiota bacterium]
MNTSSTPGGTRGNIGNAICPRPCGFSRPDRRCGTLSFARSHFRIPKPSGFSHIPAPVISTTEELRDLASRVRHAPWVALDTEADSLHAYPEKLCLIQLAIPGEAALVDPLADLHLESLWEALDHREIIFHAADYDLRLLFQGHHFRPSAIFDTMWAARLIGEPKFGLNDVLTKMLGVTLEKGAQKANWGRRPLTERMVEYALNDVRHLNELTEKLRSRLQELGRLEWHRQTCARLIADCAQPEQVDLDAVWRIKGHDRLDPLGLAILRELWHWREKDAVRSNKPPFFILRHETLSMIAADAAERRTARNLRLPPYLTFKRRQGVIDAVQRGLEVPEADLPNHIRVRSRRMLKKELDLAEELRIRRDERAADVGIDPTLVASKSTLYALARKDPGSWEDLLPWQRGFLEP